MAEKTALGNGVRILSERISSVRSVSLGVWVNVGARDEAADENGLSHFIEHMIFKGTARRSAFDIAKAFDAIGGHSNAFTGMETTCYHAKVMDAHLDTAADILADIFLNSVFDPAEVERERPVIFQEIEMVEDSPEEFIHVLAEAAFWDDHALGRPITGSRENVLRFDSDALKAFFGRLYQPDRILISAAGNVDHDRLVAQFADAFGAIESSNGFPDRGRPGGRSGVFPNERALGQIHLCLETPGISATDPRRYAASLLNTILGGNMSSRLFQEIREKRGLAYSVYSFMGSYEDAGTSGVYVGTSPEKGREALELILAELARFRDAPVDPAELRDAKEFTKGGLLLSAESVDNAMVRLAQNEIHFGDFVPLETVIERIEAVTVEEIRQLAGDLFNPARAALTILGPDGNADAYRELLAKG
ncbi:MAG: M16 family metallopeptidase [Desulfococcaceae bacterium]